MSVEQLFAFKTESKSAAKGTVSQNKSARKQARDIAANMSLGGHNVQVVEDLLYNILTCDKQLILPRPVGNFVAPHNFPFSFDVSPPTGILEGAIIVRPNSEVFLQSTTATPTNPIPLDISNIEDYAFSAQAVVTLDANWVTPSGVIKCSTASSGQSAYHFSNSAKKLVNGLKYYPGQYTMSAADIVVRVFNPNSQPINVGLELGIVNSAGMAGTSANVAKVALPANTLTGITFPQATAAAWRVACTTSAGFYIALNMDAGTKIAQGFKASIDPAYLVTPISSLTWSNYSLWDVLGPEALNAQNQFKSADRSCVTALNSVFSNVSNSFANGGTIYAARLPGNSYAKLPGDIQSLIRLISAQSHHKLETYKLKEGAAWSYTPEKIQDWLFQEPYELDPYGGNPFSLPYLVIVWVASASTGADPVFNLHGRLQMEYLTMDVSNTFVQSPSNAGLYEVLLEALSQCVVLSENPQHLKEIAKSVKRVMTSDGMKIFLRNAVGAGVKLAPMVLSMLA